MRKYTLGIGIPAAALVAVLLAFGCGSDDDPVNQPDPCSIEIFGLSSNDVFTVPEQPDDLGSDRIDVRWTATGGGEVMLELLKSGTLLGVMEDAVPNDGIQHWYIDDLVAATGSDYSVRVSSLSDDSCHDTSADFTIRDLEGCEVTMTISYSGAPDLPAVAEEFMDIAWIGAHTTESYDVELWWSPPAVQDEIIGKIYEGISGPGVNWKIDSLNRGDGWFQIMVRDAEIGSCVGESRVFEMTDDTVCGIQFDAPQGSGPYDEYDLVDISWQADGTSGLVNIELWYGQQNWLGDVILDRDAIDGGVGYYEWTVTDFGKSVPNRVSYKFRISDIDDEYCFVFSNSFEIRPAR